MGALVAILNKKGFNVHGTATTMLETLRHRGSDAFGVASHKEIVIRKSIEELRQECTDSTALVGYNFSKILPGDNYQPVKKRDHIVVFDGHVFPIPAKGEAEYMDGDKAIYFVERFNGDYAFAIAKENEIVVGRDAVGVCPLYFGENQEICAVASERKALWKIGIKTTNPFPPGRIATVTKKGFNFRVAKTIQRPPSRGLDMETAAKQLKNVLFQSVKKRVSDVNDVAVAYSGGVDSSIIALLTKLCEADIHLICVSLDDQKETAFAEKAARALGLPIHLVTYSIDDVEETLPSVLWLIEEFNPVNASIAVPMFWAAEQSTKLGFHILLAGQGGDELFGGYRRYLEHYRRYGLTGLQKRLYQDVVSAHESNFQRDNKVCTFHKTELRLPFADWEVIHFSLSIPADLKIVSPGDGLRKRVLRQTAKKLGIPKLIVEKPKKAIQYTTGVTQAMKKLAKKEGLTLRQYMKKIFLEGLQNAGTRNV